MRRIADVRPVAASDLRSRKLASGSAGRGPPEVQIELSPASTAQSALDAPVVLDEMAEETRSLLPGAAPAKVHRTQTGGCCCFLGSGVFVGIVWQGHHPALFVWHLLCVKVGYERCLYLQGLTPLPLINRLPSRSPCFP